MTCEECGQELVVGAWPWCPHGLGTPTVVDDSIPGGMTVENMGTPTPLTFYSKSEWRREMKARGLVNMVRHVPEQGSDKSAHTQRWV
jgi:hypothetical protein